MIPGALTSALREEYGLHGVELRWLSTLVNDVAEVSTSTGRYALKLYHHRRTEGAVRWEARLVEHLHRGGAPVLPPIPGRRGPVASLAVDGRPRLAVLTPWAPGAKPAPSTATYVHLGRAAALVHRAAEGYPADPGRDSYDAAVLVDEQLARMRPLLHRVGTWQSAAALGGRLRARLADPDLEWGLCHMDLSLDNVHVVEGTGDLVVFDFDSAGPCWRAVEPYGVLRFSAAFFAAWLRGYREVRAFDARNEAAVSVFAIVADLRNTAWQLGVADSSRGTPLLDEAGLAAVVEGWLAWEAAHLTCGQP